MTRDDAIDEALEMVWRKMGRVKSTDRWCRFQLFAMTIPSGVIWSFLDEDGPTVFIPDDDGGAG